MIGFIFATLIGLSLGLMGGGGSILTVPVLIYILKMDPKLSIALSLGIVGITSIVGVISNIKSKNIDFKILMMFTPFTIIGTLLGTKLAAMLPSSVQLLIFAIVMLLSSILMIKGRKETQFEDHKINMIPLILAGIFVGVLSGVVGVGGGFLIVPTLVILAKVDMKKAVGTSLFVISLSSLSGFIGYTTQFEIPWLFLSKFILFSIVGIILGTYLIKYIPAQKLKRSFGYFLIVMGIIVLYKNVDKLIL